MLIFKDSRRENKNPASLLNKMVGILGLVYVQSTAQCILSTIWVDFMYKIYIFLWLEKIRVNM